MRPSIRPVLIYRLIDPRDQRVRYVGKTETRLSRRLAGHIKQAKDGRGGSSAPWILDLLAQGLRPRIEMIETVPVGNAWPAREKHWIAEYRRQYPDLLNIALGGAGGGAIYMTPEVKERLRIAAKQQWVDGGETMRQKQLKRVNDYWSDERNHAIQRERARAQMANPQYKNRVAEAIKRKFSDPLYREKHSLLTKKWWAEHPEARAVAAEKTRRVFFNPGHRAAHGALSAQIANKVAAKRLKISLSEYQNLLDAEQKLCTNCGVLHRFLEFGLDKRGTRGLSSTCRKSRNAKLKAQRDIQSGKTA